jgi:hypothetical protein
MSFAGLVRVYRARIGIQLGHYFVEPLFHLGGGVVWRGSGWCAGGLVSGGFRA